MLSQGHVRPVLYGEIIAAILNLLLLVILTIREGGGVNP